MQHIPLCVPYWSQSDALAAGARYTEALGFHAPADAYLDPLWEWLPRMYQPGRTSPVLLPDMLPVTTWEQNVRFAMPDAWDRIRKHAYKAAGYRCEICGDSGRMEAHELWRLVNETCQQQLVKIMGLCPACHKCHHIGLARRMGMMADVQNQLMRVNGWNSTQMHIALNDTLEMWEQRCDWPWEVDLSWLHRSGYLYV